MKINRQLLIFDLDGVIIDSTKRMHQDTLISSILEYNPKFELDEKAQALMDTSLTSKTKIDRMIEMGMSIDDSTINQIIAYKQRLTNHAIDNLEVNEELVSVLSQLCEHSVTAIASNSHSETVDRIVHQIGINRLIGFTIGNDLVHNTKPHPEIFWACMSHFGYYPSETVIFEDSPQGRDAAISSGARVEDIDNNAHLISILKDKYV